MQLIGHGYLTDIPAVVPQGTTLLLGGWGISGAVLSHGELQMWGTPHEDCEDVVVGCLGWQALCLTRRDDRHLHVLPTTPCETSHPIRLELPRWTNVCHIAAGEGICSNGQMTGIVLGEGHVLCAMEDGSVWSWGDNRNGCLGIGRRDVTARSLQCVLGPGCEEGDRLATEPVRRVACGMVHSCAMTQRGAVFCWGCNLHGECGQISKEDITKPQYVEEMGGVEVQSISAGLHHTMALSGCAGLSRWAGSLTQWVYLVSGDVYGWGSNADGQLGMTEQVLHPLPVLVDAALLEHVDIVKVREWNVRSWYWSGWKGLGVLRGTSHNGSVEGRRRLRLGMECLSTGVTSCRIVLYLGASRRGFRLPGYHHGPLAFHPPQRAAAFMM